MDKNRILLDTGTNELEIVEFCVGKSKFGINVMKVREIINPVAITPIPHSHKYVEGIIELRGEILPIVDVAKVLNYPPSNNEVEHKYIVAEFNKRKIVFRVHSVTQIHRISWKQIEKPSAMYQGVETQLIGVVKLNGEMILLLDFEKVLVEIHPESGISKGKGYIVHKEERRTKNIILVEDSPLLRKLIQGTLKEAGYEKVQLFENGQEAIEHLLSLKKGKQLTEEIDLIITDIEMPMLDGHALTKRLKSDDLLKRIPIIIFSSLITSDLKHRGQLVGADEQVSKPEIGELVTKMDRLIFE